MELAAAPGSLGGRTSIRRQPVGIRPLLTHWNGGVTWCVMTLVLPLGRRELLRLLTLAGFAPAMRAQAEPSFEDSLVHHCREFDRLTCNDLDDVALRAFVQQGMSRAFAYGFDLQGPVRFFVELLFILGNGFDTDPMYPWAREWLVAAGPPMPRADKLWELTVAYQKKVPAAAGNRAIERWLSSFRVPAVTGPGGFTTGMLEEFARLYPEKAATVGHDAMVRVVEEASTEADRRGFATAEGRALLCELYFALGHGALTDPLFPTLGPALADLSLPVERRLERLRNELRGLVRRRVRGLFGLK